MQLYYVLILVLHYIKKNHSIQYIIIYNKNLYITILISSEILQGFVQYNVYAVLMKIVNLFGFLRIQINYQTMPYIAF